jgi:hypothetical protein
LSTVLVIAPDVVDPATDADPPEVALFRASNLF